LEDNKKITRRTFLKKAGKLVYLTPVMYTFFTDAKEAFAQGQRAAAAERAAAAREAALQRQVEALQRAAEAGNQRAAVALQQLRERLVSPP